MDRDFVSCGDEWVDYDVVVAALLWGMRGGELFDARVVKRPVREGVNGVGAVFSEGYSDYSPGLCDEGVTPPGVKGCDGGWEALILNVARDDSQ